MAACLNELSSRTVCLPWRDWFGGFDMVFLLGALAFHEDHFAQNERQRDTGPVRSKRREILKPPYLARIVLYEDDQVMTYHVWLV